MVTVTGAAGHVGNTLVRVLLAREERVRAVTHHDCRALEGLDVDIVQGDVLSRESLEKAFQSTDVVFHTAAYITIAPDKQQILETVNVSGTRNVCEAARICRVRRLVHFSSIEAISDEPHDTPVDEDRQLVQSHSRGYPPYAHSKAAGQREVLRAIEHGLNAVIINPTACLGPHDFRSGLPNSSILALADGKLLALIAGGFDWVDARDVAEGAIQGTETAPSGGHWANLEQLAQIVGEVTGRRIRLPVLPMWLARGIAPHHRRGQPDDGQAPAGHTGSTPATPRLSQCEPRPGSARTRLCPPPAARHSRGYPEVVWETVSEIEVFNGLTVAWFVMSAAAFVVLFFTSAPYGRHTRTGWGATLPSHWGWLLMESAAPLTFLLMFLIGRQPHSPAAWVFLGLWEAHYIHRAFIYPFQRRDRGKQMPIGIVAMAFFFNVVNGYLNGRYLFELGPEYSTAWLLTGRFITGSVFYLLGFAMNRQSDMILQGLRKPEETDYKIPYAGLFRWVSCPNYLGEIIEWMGWAVATWSLPGLAFAVWTAANLVPRARSHHRWYQSEFAGYPSDRRALIPRVW